MSSYVILTDIEDIARDIGKEFILSDPTFSDLSVIRGIASRGRIKFPERVTRLCVNCNGFNIASVCARRCTPHYLATIMTIRRMISPPQEWRIAVCVLVGDSTIHDDLSVIVDKETTWDGF
jgi:hypothetical protein